MFFYARKIAFLRSLDKGSASGGKHKSCKNQGKFQSAQPARTILAILAILDEPQLTMIILYPFIQHNRAETPLPVMGQLSLQLLASINKTYIACRITKIAVSTRAATAWNLERLARVDEVWVVDIVVAGNLVKGAVETSCDGAEGVAMLDSDSVASATLSAVDPAEAAAVVFEDSVEGDGAVAARAIATSA